MMKKNQQKRTSEITDDRIVYKDVKYTSFVYLKVKESMSVARREDALY